MSSLDELLIKKIPSSVQDSPEFKILVKLAKEKKFKTMLDLKSYLKNEIKSTRKKFIESEKAGTNNKQRIEYAKRMDAMENMLKIIRAYFR
ncbi:MAG: hypothetical protein N3D84_00055 [Candidatus Woesearchaeota archaeon]|nr:hypothetical protein [Candidatus Woesearchaeota archaeon]